jgi:hypothetical protein
MEAKHASPDPAAAGTPSNGGLKKESTQIRLLKEAEATTISDFIKVADGKVVDEKPVGRASPATLMSKSLLQ